MARDGTGYRYSNPTSPSLHLHLLLLGSHVLPINILTAIGSQILALLLRLPLRLRVHLGWGSLGRGWEIRGGGQGG